MKKLIPLLALFVLCGCKSATLNHSFDVAKSIIATGEAVVDDVKGAVGTINDSFNYVKTNVVNAVKGTNSVSVAK